ncbi:hypothetical protein BKA63DRAFT_319292 [Paraphoma chrysanthemicola]|nr:hypothetical protein BKA63DRAFT_319292 [Paraphoma chrysanthemicola]
MARTREMDESARQTARKSMQPKGKQLRGKPQDGHGRDPWVFVDENNAAAGVTTDTISAATTIKEDEDSVLGAPAPIHAIAPFKLVAPDGRETYIYQPLSGFEHLFKAPQDARGAYDATRSYQVPVQTSQLQRFPALAGAPQQGSAHATRCQDGMRMQNDRPHKHSLLAKKKAVHKPPKRKALKRSRSIAQGLSQQPSVSDASEDDNDDGDEDKRKEVTVITETARHFEMGDIKALKTFFRHRIDELTMKPVRGMVTGWIKQLEPRRLGGYGPYHRKLPTEAPADATPPWWPQSVPYIEPAHLDKDGLLTLAVEVMLQHRDSPTDEIKRRSPWTVKLRQIAEYNVETTAPEHFSSSKSAVFSRMMKERAVKSILPSLFETSQSYEDFVFQHDLWKHRDEKKFPRGKSITWQSVPRPPKQTNQRKRPRKARATRVLRDDTDTESLGEASADDTEVDDTMARRASRQVRQKEFSSQQQRAMLEEEDAQYAPAPASVLPNAVVDASPRMSASKRVLQPAQVHPTPNTSFDQSLGRLRLDEDAKAANLVTTDNNDQQVQQGRTPHSQTIQYDNSHGHYTNSSFHPMHSSGPYSTPVSTAFAPFPTGNYIDPSQYPVYNSTYTLAMSQPSMDASMTAHDMAYSYSSEGLFTPATFMPDMSANANTSFNGLPYSYDISSTAPPHHYLGPQMVGHNDTQ